MWHSKTAKKVLVAALVFGISVFAFAGGPKEDNQSLLLRVATCVDKPVLTLAFIAKNTGSRLIETTPICTNYNRLIIRRPTGEVQEQFWWKDGIDPVVIAPGETTVWYVNNLAELIKVKENGEYGIRWKVGETVSEELLILKGERAETKKASP